MGIHDCSWFSISWAAAHNTSHPAINKTRPHLTVAGTSACTRVRCRSKGEKLSKFVYRTDFHPRMRLANERQLLNHRSGCERNVRISNKTLVYNNTGCRERFTFYKIKILYYWKVNLVLSRYRSSSCFRKYLLARARAYVSPIDRELRRYLWLRKRSMHRDRGLRREDDYYDCIFCTSNSRHEKRRTPLNVCRFSLRISADWMDDCIGAKIVGNTDK